MSSTDRPEPLAQESPGPIPVPDVPADLIEVEHSLQQAATSTAIYLEALRRPGLTRSMLRGRGHASAAIDAGTESLQQMGLLRGTGGGDTWEALPPDIALPAYAHGLERRAALARSLTDELTRTFHRARDTDEDEEHGIRVLSSLQEVQDATDRICATAADTLRCLRDDSPRTAYVFGGDLDVLRERAIGARGTPLTWRTTYDTSILGFPRAGDVLLARVEGGEEFRFLSGLPFSVTVADSTAAVLDLTSYDSSGRGCLLVRDRRLVLALGALCDLLFALAAPMSRPGQAPLDRRSIFILSLLAGGATDAMIAQQAEVSQRTVERTVRALMEQHGAATRFQAGVLAARRGWL